MGLDTYALDSRTRQPLPDSKFAHIPGVLCGGIFSGSDGTGCAASFRGKVYSNFVETVTGQHLYQEEIPPATVRQIADSLQSWIERNPDLVRNQWEITESEIRALAEWFSTAAQSEAVVVGWW